MKRGRVCQTQRCPGSTAPGWIGHRGGLGHRVEIAMTDYALALGVANGGNGLSSS
jgi:hypothetical protein